MRILLLADTHIGLDLPLNPRIERRRRGHDFLSNFRQALEPARAGEVDLVIHGGDLLNRSIVPPGILEMAMEPLVEVACQGVPIYLVPGNHERSRIPLHLWANHAGIHIFDHPRTFRQRVGDQTVALTGFPFIRDIRHRFGSVLDAAGYRPDGADAALLCMHQAVEGARVGPGHFTFRHGKQVVRAADLPMGMNAVVTGHIHRAQVLRGDLSRRPLPAPVIYPGSVERTSWAERDEPKGYVILTLDGTSPTREPDLDWVRLHARPMIDVEVEASDRVGDLEARLLSQLKPLPPDAIVHVHLRGPWNHAARTTLAAENLRRLAPSTMNISLQDDGGGSRRAAGAQSATAA